VNLGSTLWGPPSPLPLDVAHPRLVRATAFGIVGIMTATLATLGALAAPARGGPQGAAVLVNETVAGPQSAPAVSWDGQNRATVWTGPAPEGGSTVFMRTSSSGEQRVSPDGASAPVGDASVSIGRGTDRFAVVWPGQRVTANGTDYVTFVRFFSLAGSPLTGVIEVSTSPSVRKAAASVAVHVSSGILITWVVWAEDGITGGVMARRIALHGDGSVTMDPLALKLPEVPPGAVTPRVAVDDASNAAVTWVEPTTSTAYLATYNPQYGARSAVQTLGVGADPAVARAPSGATVAAWSATSAGDPDGGILARRFDIDGSPVGDAFAVNTNTGGAQREPAVGIGDNGRFVVGWLGGAGLSLQRFEADGTRLGRETSLNPPTIVPSAGPSISTAGDDSYVAAWPGAGPEDDAGVYALPFTFDDAPVANGDSYSVAHDTPLTVDSSGGLLANDTDNDGDALSVQSLPKTPPSQGTVSLQPDGAFTYTPNPGVGGGGDATDQFQYIVTDGRNGTIGTAVVTIRSTNLNRPVAADDSYTTPQGRQLAVAAPGVLANDTDPDGDQLTVFPGPRPRVGSVQMFEDGSFLYTPPPTYCGPDTFTYYAYDGVHYSAEEATVTILIPCDQAPPQAQPDRYTTPESTVLSVPSPGVLANDRDPNLDNMVARLQEVPQHGTVDLGFDGEFVYTPDAGFVGDDTFTYVADDGRDVSAPATVTITVTATIGDLALVADEYAVEQDGVLSVPAPGLLANDHGTAHRQLAVELGTPPANGIVELNSDGGFVYAPAPGFSGSDRFGYVVNGAGDEGTVDITITPAATSPTSAPAAAAVIARPVAGPPAAALAPPPTIPDEDPPTVGAGGASGGGTAGGDGSGGAADSGGGSPPTEPAEEGTLDLDAGAGDAVSIPVEPQNGTAYANPDRTITYRPAPHFTGRDSFEYTVCSRNGTCATKTEGITVARDAHDGPRTVVFDPILRTRPDRPGWLVVALLVVVGVVVIALILGLVRRVVPRADGLQPPSPPPRRGRRPALT
jgi:hypothetical protein